MDRQPPSRQRHGRKQSSTGNAFSSSVSPSFSVKEPSDKVSFSRGEKGVQFGIHEYAEIFSGSPSSIPVLDLSSLDERVGSRDFRSFRLDYTNIFGAGRDDEVAVPYEELASGGGKKTKMQIPADDVQPPCPESSSQCSSVKNKKSSNEANEESSIDSMKKQFNISFNKTNQRVENEPNGKTHIAQLHAVPGFTHFVDEAGTSSLHKKEGDNPLSSLKREVSRTWSFSVGVNMGLNVETLHAPDKPGDLNEINLKPCSPKMLSPSSHPIAESDPRKSNCPNFDSKDLSKKTDGDCTLPVFDEELDENSAAALSAAALKKAVDQAQESIRIARMIMERQKETLQGGPKPRSWGCSKVKDDNETRVDKEANVSVDINAVETYKGLDELPIFTGINGKSAKSLHNTEKFLNTREVEAAKETGDASSEVGNRAASWSQNVETPEACRGDATFKGLGTKEDYKTEDMVLEKVDNHGHVTCSIEKLQSHLEKIETLTGTLEQLTSNKSKGDEANAELAEGGPGTSNSTQETGKRVDDALGQNEASVYIRKDSDDIAESSERVLPSKSIQQHGMAVCETDENLSIMQKEEVMEQRDDAAGIKLKHDKKFVDTEEMVLGEHLTVLKSDLSGSLSGFRCLVEENILRLEVMENGGHGQRNDEEESRVRSEDRPLCVGIESQLKDSSNGEISGREPEIFPAVSDLINVNVVQQEMDGGKEKHETLGMDLSEVDAGKSTWDEAKHCADVHKGEASWDAVEIMGVCTEAGRSEENNDIIDFPNPASVNNVGETVDVHTDDASKVSSEIQEPRDADLNNKAASYGAAVEGCTGNACSIRIADVFTSAEDNDTGTLFHPEVKMPGTDSLRRCASEENFVGSKLIGAFEGFSSDSSTDIAGTVDVDHEEKLTRSMDLFKDDSKINNVAEEEAAEFHRRLELDETSEGIRCSVSSSREAQECANAENNTENEEGVNYDLDMTTDGRENIEKQRELLSAESKDVKEGKNIDKNMENLSGLSTLKQKDGRGKWQKIESSDRQQRIEAIKKGREREKDRKVVERAIREARERAFAEAQEKADRVAVEKAAAEAQQRHMTETLEKLEKASIDSKHSADKLSTEAKIRAERAAVERATAEARERALKKAMSQKTYTEANLHSTERVSTASLDKGLKHSFSSSDLEKFDENTSESAQRRKAKLERHQRIMERAAQALSEKNKRDLQAEKEQAEKNRLAETLDPEIKRWAAGKEGNLRALLSTLQYILGPDSGWQPTPLTEIITGAAVKKAYRKATLCVHPDKLQQRGATYQQKYICEKVFDLLKAAWNRFNSEEN